MQTPVGWEEINIFMPERKEGKKQEALEILE